MPWLDISCTVTPFHSWFVGRVLCQFVMPTVLSFCRCGAGEWWTARSRVNAREQSSWPSSVRACCLDGSCCGGQDGKIHRSVSRGAQHSPARFVVQTKCLSLLLLDCEVETTMRKESSQALDTISDLFWICWPESLIPEFENLMEVQFIAHEAAFSSEGYVCSLRVSLTFPCVVFCLRGKKTHWKEEKHFDVCAHDRVHPRLLVSEKKWCWPSSQLVSLNDRILFSTGRRKCR